MVEYELQLDSVFYSLADPTRRDMLRRVSKKELSVSELAEPYKLTFAAISKHLQVLEKAKLITKRRKGTFQYISPSPIALKEASQYLEKYKKLWEDRFERLDTILKQEKNSK